LAALRSGADLHVVVSVRKVILQETSPGFFGEKMAFFILKKNSQYFEHTMAAFSPIFSDKIF
jgi:hypothetical protein